VQVVAAVARHHIACIRLGPTSKKFRGSLHDGTEMNRTCPVLLDVNNTIFGPCLAACTSAGLPSLSACPKLVLSSFQAVMHIIRPDPMSGCQMGIKCPILCIRVVQLHIIWELAEERSIKR
jgi:hypothetical protein